MLARVPALELPSALAAARERLSRRGFDLSGVAGPAGLVHAGGPSGYSALVIGSGGRRLWPEVRERVDGRPWRVGFDPLDDYTEEVVEAERERLVAAGYAALALFPFALRGADGVRRPDGLGGAAGQRVVDFQRLAVAAGLGVKSPVVPFVLHPEHGPWISLRAALLVPGELAATGPLEGFAPCEGCHRPCLAACPVAVFQPPARPDLEACAGHRHGGGCEQGCGVRSACPVGADSRYGPEEERFRHGSSLETLRRAFGLGRARTAEPPPDRRA